MTNTTTPRALREYRALDTEARRAYNPAGKAGADAVRHLQLVAKAVATLRDARHQARTNPQFPASRLCAAQRDVALLTKRATNLPRDAVRVYHTLPLGAEDADVAITAARAAHPRRKNWISVEPSTGPAAVGACIERAIEYKGKYKGWRGAEYAPTMRALVRISLDGQIMTAIIGHTDGGGRPETTYTLQAGRGYQWGTDTHGVRLVRLADGDDYHPTTDEVRAGRAAIVTALRERSTTRKAASKAAQREAAVIERACKDGVWVCLGDSIAAGNCRAGTESFARRHGLDTRRHYRADALPATGADSRRVALAVLAAQRRQVREMISGICEIA